MLEQPRSLDVLDTGAPSSGHVLPLELRRLSLETGGRRLIDSVDLKVEEPGVTVILGPNGAGKSVLLRRTSAANITYALGLRGIARSERNSRAQQALELAGLERHAFTPARVLSGGEQQRLCLARALSLDPEVLLLDEPTASLDPASTLAIERLLIGAKRRGIKVMVVTHDVGQARRLAQDVIFLHHGRLIEHQPAGRFFEYPESDTARAFMAGGLVL